MRRAVSVAIVDLLITLAVGNGEHYADAPRGTTMRIARDSAVHEVLRAGSWAVRAQM